ncbi:hypothetical protein BDR22DRAFT_912073, partial [Usnea florida]
ETWERVFDCSPYAQDLPLGFRSFLPILLFLEHNNSKPPFPNPHFLSSKKKKEKKKRKTKQKMCINEPPLSTVRYLADALSLHPVPTPDPPQRTPSELTLFRRTFLPILARTTISITEQDREEMRSRGLPPITDADVAAARRRYAREQRVLRERPRSEEPFRALALRLNPDPVPQEAPVLGTPVRDVGTNGFENRMLGDGLPEPGPEGRASELENGNRDGATDGGAGRRVLSDDERWRWNMTREEVQALIVDVLRSRREDEEGGGEGRSEG